MIRPVPVPRGALEILKRMLVAWDALTFGDEADDELVREEGAGWVQGDDTMHPPACNWLVSHLLVRLSTEVGADVERWVLNEHGREAAKTGWLPAEVVEILTKAPGVFGT